MPKSKPKYSPGDRVIVKLHWAPFDSFTALVLNSKYMGNRWYNIIRYIDPNNKRTYEDSFDEKYLHPAQQEMILSKKDLYEQEDPSIGYLGPNTYFVASEEDDEPKTHKRNPLTAREI